nr:unnamed protein product [Spirometra erinaceieuropaei]
MGLQTLILLPAAFIFLGGVFARADGPSDYKLCKGEHTECTTINFKPGDQTKGQHCRTACSQKIGGLSEKITAYYCETPEEPCTL